MKLVPLVLTALGLTLSAQATITVQNFWHIGEDNNVLPTDSVGSNPFDSGYGTRAVSTLTYAPGGSTASLHFDGTTDAGWGGDWLNNTTVSVPADNWVAELWVNLDSIDAGPVELLTLGNADQAAQIGVENGNWSFVSFNWAYLNNSVAATAGSWTELAWARDNGVNEFFVNGTMIGTDTSTEINNGAFTLASQPGVGNREPTGYIDEIRFSTFNPGEFSVNDLMVSSVPEPGVMALAGLGGGMMILMWKNRRRS